jgi:hypothetical protein
VDRYDRPQALREWRQWQQTTWGGAVQQALGITEAERAAEELELRQRARDFQDEFEMAYDRRPSIGEASHAVAHNADGRNVFRRGDVLSGTTAEVAAALHRQRPDTYIGVGTEMPDRWAGGRAPWGGIAYSETGPVTQIGDPRHAADVERWAHLSRTVA